MNELNLPLDVVDPDVAKYLALELDRQRDTLEMIASENFAPLAVMQAQGSVATNKYAEGYPGRRYYGGCEHVDEIERIAIARVTRLFSAQFANVQPHSGAQANMAAFMATLQPGDTILGLDLNHGGHLSHGMRINVSGLMYNVVHYHVDDSGFIDMREVEELAQLHRPKLIIAGWSAYPRGLDFEQFRRIADGIDAFLLVDMAHFAGLVAAGLYANPMEFAHIVTSTTHKTLGGPRGGIVLTNDEVLAKKVNSAVFPGVQGGPLEHVIAAKAVCFNVAGTSEFRARMLRTVDGARALANRLLEADVVQAGIGIQTQGTDVHFVLVDLRHSRLDGAEGERILDEVGITVNRNAVPHDPRPPMVTSGLRIGTTALATRGLGHADFEEVADVIAMALVHGNDHVVREELTSRTQAIAHAFPLYPSL